MNGKKFKKLQYKKDNLAYMIEEDLVGWYLIVYNERNIGKASEDYLFDTLEGALFEAEDRFSIPKNTWVEI